MNNRLIFYVIFCMSLISSGWSQKILKVKGNKLVISTKSISVEEGDVLTITSDGFEAGKVKILKVGSKTAIGKITEGSALKGDSVSSDSESSSSSSSSSDDEPKTSKKKKKSSFGKGKFSAHLGLSYTMLSNIASEQGDYALDGHSGFILKGEYRASTDRTYVFGLEMNSGSATFTSKLTGLTITGIDVETTNLFARINTPINANFYYSYGGQFSMVSVTDTMTFGAFTGAHKVDLKGLGGLGGIGYNYFLGPLVLQAEALAEFNYYFMNESTAPAGIPASDDAGTFMTYGLQFGLSVGYRF